MMLLFFPNGNDRKEVLHVHLLGLSLILGFLLLVTGASRLLSIPFGLLGCCLGLFGGLLCSLGILQQSQL